MVAFSGERISAEMPRQMVVMAAEAITSSTRRVNRSPGIPGQTNSTKSPIQSDCAALHGLISTLLAAAPGTRFIRDATRGGIASVLNEIAEASACAIEIHEASTPIRQEVKGFCEILGLDPLYLANEGKLAAVVPESEADAALQALRAHPLGREAADIGAVLTGGRAGRVHMQTVFGGRRIVDMLIGEQLPRIC